ncbi:MAG TPA: hypothetical protein VGX92_03515 [Pyrinomonadaceae bacterium]|jgi:hypothetical protein|nr:hypothetical protein [Pyrinomonadaceae bacterium]
MPDDFDLASFQAEVLQKVSVVQQIQSYAPKFDELSGEFGEWHSSIPGTEKRQHPFWYVVASAFSNFMQWIQGKITRMIKEDRKLQQARAIIRRNDIKERLCPLLAGTDNEAMEIAKIITPELVAAKDQMIALDAVMFALCAWEISRVGVRNYCAA